MLEGYQYVLCPWRCYLLEKVVLFILSDLKRIWFEKLGIKHLDLDYGFVCSRHFERDQYKRDLQAELLGYVGRRKLKPDAVPTLHLPIKQEKISPEEKERLAKEQHKKLIQDCLNRSSEEKSILGFELFKKLKYTQTSTRGRPKKNVTPQRRVGKNVNDEHQNIIRYYDGEPRVYLVSSDTDQDLHSSTFEDSTIDSFTENRNPAVYSYKGKTLFLLIIVLKYCLMSYAGVRLCVDSLHMRSTNRTISDKTEREWSI